MAVGIFPNFLYRLLLNAENSLKRTRVCPNCKKDLGTGPGHFCPPCMGEEGFFTCQKEGEIDLMKALVKSLKTHPQHHENCDSIRSVSDIVAGITKPCNCGVAQGAQSGN
jgi:hypothetical protein